MSNLTIEHALPEAWERVRTLRLRALADSPDAFSRTLAEEEVLGPEHWRGRLESTVNATFLALLEGQGVGLAVGAPSNECEGAAALYGLWVAPEARGHGAAAALVGAVTQWARGRGFPAVALDVADTNLAAVRLYERLGFERTGVLGALPPPREHVLEHQRVLKLR